MASSSKNVQSSSDPSERGFRVTKTELELFVDFKRTVLTGCATLTLCKIDNNPANNKIILDIYGLHIICVRDLTTMITLEYEIVEYSNIFGSKLIIKISPGYDRYIIQIGYETSPNSPVLCWLKAEQTSGGHPLLIPNYKLTYAKAIFPCQDTPLIKFDFSAIISVPKGFNVLMSRICMEKYVSDDESRDKYKSFTHTKISSREVVIVVGLLKNVIIQTISGDVHISCRIWAEQKYIQKTNMILTHMFKTLFKTHIFKKWYKFIEFNVCVLPPNVPEFDAQCPYMAFISSTLLKHQFESNIYVLQHIIESWTENVLGHYHYHYFEDLWLIKSCSIFICRKIIHHTLDEVIKKWLDIKSVNKLESIPLMSLSMMMKNHGECCHRGYRLKRYLFQKDIIEYVPYEKGYLLLSYLEFCLGSTNFEKWFDYYLILINYRGETTSLTEVFEISLFDFFSAQEQDNTLPILYTINWNMWFYDETLNSVNDDETLNSFIRSFSDSEYMVRNVRLTTGQCILNEYEIRVSLAQIRNSSYFNKIEFLSYLFYICPTILSSDKFDLLRSVYLNDKSIGIKFLWLRLCIKYKWLTIIEPALKFASKHCTPKYACPIIRDLCKWPELQPLVLSWLYKSENKSKMLPEIIKELESIMWLL